MASKDECIFNTEHEIQDDDSIIEKCWTEKYKGDSRKWLIRDGSYKKPRDLVCSTMKTSYTFPENEKKADVIGQRKAGLLKKFECEATAEIYRELNAPAAIEKYCTEYDGNFNLPGFQLEERQYKKDSELYEKYPLYSSAPTSYYSYNLKKRPKEILHGLTPTFDNINPFKRSAGFSKPLSDVLDEQFW